MCSTTAVTAWRQDQAGVLDSCSHCVEARPSRCARQLQSLRRGQTKPMCSTAAVTAWRQEPEWSRHCLRTRPRVESSLYTYKARCGVVTVYIQGQVLSPHCLRTRPRVESSLPGDQARCVCTRPSVESSLHEDGHAVVVTSLCFACGEGVSESN